MSTISKVVRPSISLGFTSAFYKFQRGTNFLDECGPLSTRGKCSGSKRKKKKSRPPSPSSGDNDNPGAPTMYDSRKFGHKLSTNNVCPGFETVPNVPTGVFRRTTGEVLGRGAAKCTYYQNPEYFSYHHMSFYDINIALRQYRKPCPKTGRKPV